MNVHAFGADYSHHHPSVRCMVVAVMLTRTAALLNMKDLASKTVHLVLWCPLSNLQVLGSGDACTLLGLTPCKMVPGPTCNSPLCKVLNGPGPTIISFNDFRSSVGYVLLTSCYTVSLTWKYMDICETLRRVLASSIWCQHEYHLLLHTPS